MDPGGDPHPLPEAWHRRPSLALALVVLIGFGLRAQASLVPDCIPGCDGAYHFVQVRGLLREGSLPFPDFPLLYYALAVKTLRVTGLVQSAREDLERMKTAMPRRRNLVIVNHGLRWWTAWVLEIHFCTSAARALADRESCDAALLLEEIRPGAFGGFHSKLATTPGGSLRDGERLQGETFTVLREGQYFRLSRLQGSLPPAR